MERSPSPGAAVPLRENAAPLYQRGFALLKAAPHDLPLERLIPRIIAGKVDAAETARVRQALRMIDPALTLVKQGASRKDCSFDRDWEKGVDLSFPELGFAQTAVRVLVVRALLAPDSSAAVSDLWAAAVLRAHVGNESTVISALLGRRIEIDVHLAVRYLAARGVSPQALRPVIANLGPLPDLRRVCASDAVTGAHLGELLARGGEENFTMSGQALPMRYQLGRLTAGRNAFTARAIEYWRDVYRELPHDPLDRQGNARALRNRSAGWKGVSYTGLNLVVPLFSGLSSLGAELETERRLTLASLELEDGKKPVLAPDPFSIGPLKLKRTGHDWILWSVGPDGKDDGGRPQIGRSKENYDLVVRHDA